ncbi:MAG: hypothetical protein ACLTGS_14640 [Mediterraneibacter gnavus]
MGKYPDFNFLKINAAAYEDAFDFAVQIMQRTAEEFQFLSDSEYLVNMINLYIENFGQ